MVTQTMNGRNAKGHTSTEAAPLLPPLELGSLRIVDRDRNSAADPILARYLPAPAAAVEIVLIAEESMGQFEQAMQTDLANLRARFAHVRERFRETAEHETWHRAATRLAETRAALVQAEKTAEAAQRHAGKLLVAEMDPATAEEQYRRARIDAEILSSRLTTLRELEGTSRGRAERALREALEAERAIIVTAARADREELRAELLEFLRQKLAPYARVNDLLWVTDVPEASRAIGTRQDIVDDYLDLPV